MGDSILYGFVKKMFSLQQTTERAHISNIVDFEQIKANLSHVYMGAWLERHF